MYCTNKNSSHYGNTLFLSHKWKINQGCDICGHDLTHIKPQKENHANTKTHPGRDDEEKKEGNEELISFQEFQERTQGSKESTTGSRTSEGSGQQPARSHSGRAEICTCDQQLQLQFGTASAPYRSGCLDRL